MPSGVWSFAFVDWLGGVSVSVQHPAPAHQMKLAMNVGGGGGTFLRVVYFSILEFNETFQEI